MAATGLVALLAGCGSSSRDVTSVAATLGGDAASTVTGMEDANVQVVQAVLPSVVQIDTDLGEGSGIVYDTDGNIVTNAHVVAGAKEFQVRPSSGGKPLKATLVGQFQAGDLAVVKVDPAAKLPPARFGDSAQLKVGQLVLAMGSPLGLSGSVTNGIVSAIGRTVSSQREGAFPGATIASAVQTSAAINPGNSGGALVRMNGEIVGIPTLAAGTRAGSLADGIGFAIPSDTVKNIAPQLIADGKVTNSGRAALGATIAQTFVSNGESNGVAVVSVVPGGAAAKAGMKDGDVVTAVNGEPTPTTTALAEALAPLKPGQTIKVDILRNGRKQTLEITLGELPGS
ncbi:S1C family serine protease [Actinocorallia longicatena]|uniref:Trypsin-like peptidase domain-containing protein n=1 Tax=Actinocorallia longicatena TaxID=111803 RepID=A0ABP6QAE1_9ACTN